MAKNKDKTWWWGGTQPFFLHPLLSHLTPVLDNQKFLDLGCGKGTNGFLIRTSRDLNGSLLIGLDSNQGFLDFCKKHKVYDKLIKATLPKIPLKDKSIDFIMCTEVIEHLSKKDGTALLSEVDRVCKGRALVSTPNVYFDTRRSRDRDAHKSFWSASDFRKSGYKVYGLGFKVALLQFRPLLKFKQALYYLMTPFSYFIPEIGGNLVCVKDY